MRDCILLTSPLEQFQITALIPLNIVSFDLSITNFLLVNILTVMIVVSIIYFNNCDNKSCLQKNSFFFAANAWQKLLESLAEITTQVISNIIITKNEKYVPFILMLFNFILFSNLIGLIPYSFTATSHIIVTFMLSFSIFIGINLTTCTTYQIKTFSLFLPANTTFFLSLLLVPVEFTSYIAKPISLGIRLFINIMAGHSLLKILIGFSWGILLLENFISISLILPVIILVLLFGLELSVALIQTYVFIVLTCIFIQDGS